MPHDSLLNQTTRPWQGDMHKSVQFSVPERDLEISLVAQSGIKACGFLSDQIQ